MSAGPRYIQAMNTALREAMSADERVVVLGEDVGQSLRGVTRDLQRDFGDQRVIDTPLSEQSFTSFATGMALAGYRPVVEYQIPSLVYLTFEQIVNQAQKFRLMTGGQAGVPVTYLVPGSGARAGLAGQHSDNPYTFFVHAGVKTVVPSTAEDAYGLLKAAIADDDPVIVFAPAALLGSRASGELQAVSLGVGAIRREGADVTLVAVGHLVDVALAVAEQLAPEMSVEVIDPRTLYPLDWTLISDSARKTGRLVVVDDSNISAGFAGEIVATVAETVPLRARPKRVSRADAVVPFAVDLERVLLPDENKITTALRTVMEEDNA